MKKIFPLLFAALLVLTAFAACSHEEKKPDGESDLYPSYSVNADDMNGIHRGWNESPGNGGIY